MSILTARRWFMAVAVAVAAHALHAQTPTFRTGVNVVRIDASVVDAKGAPIRGLTADDFTVLEDGAPRPITAFEAIDMPADARGTGGEAAWVSTAPRDVVSNRVEDRRLLLVVIDDVTMPHDPLIVDEAKRIASDIVSRLGEHDRCAIVFTRNSRKAQPFTSDRSRLLAAIGATTGGTMQTWNGDAEVMLYLMGATRTLRQSVEAMLDAPQVRKTLVFISTGLPMNPASMEPRMSKMGGATDDVSVPNVNAERDWLIESRKLFEQAERGHVRVYTFDPGGLDGLARHAGTDVALQAQGSLISMAAETGGRSVIGPSNMQQGVTQMFVDSSTFYVIGFQSASTEPGRHRVEVRTSRSGARVQTRSAFEVRPAAKPAKTPVSPLAAAISGVLPEDGLPLRVAATALPVSTGKGAMLAITLGVNQPADDVQGPERLVVQISAYETTGALAGSTQLDTKLSLRPSASGRAQYELLAKLPIGPGRYQLRIAAHSPRLKLRGSVFADVDVPDFARAPLTMTPLVLASTPAPLAAPADAFAGLLPVIPTSHRSFGGTDRVTVLARVVQSGRNRAAAIDIDGRIVDSHDRQMSRRREPLVMNSATHGGDYSLELPLETLAPGDYLLTITARTATGTTERTLRFQRR